MDQEIRDRLARIESKLELILPHISQSHTKLEGSHDDLVKRVDKIDSDVSFARRGLALAWTVLIGLAGIFYTKH